MTSSDPAPRHRTPLEPLLDAIEAAEVLDAPARSVGSVLRRVTSPRALKEALSGTWLGHAVHPLLTDLVIGSFLSATVLDVVGGDRDGRASRRLIAVGIAAYPPTALTGGSDWSDAQERDPAVRRAGLVHAATNAAALAFYAGSLMARRRGAPARGVLLGLGGASALGSAAYLGGHLSYAKGVGVHETPATSGRAPTDRVGRPSASDGSDPGGDRDSTRDPARPGQRPGR